MKKAIIGHARKTVLVAVLATLLASCTTPAQRIGSDATSEPAPRDSSELPPPVSAANVADDRTGVTAPAEQDATPGGGSAGDEPAVTVQVEIGELPPPPPPPPAPAPVSVSNPVADWDTPDPFVLRANGRYYAYTTNVFPFGFPVNVQTLESSDLATWEPVADALPNLPAWAKPGFTWAPAVLARPGGYVLYFVARHTASGRQCIGAATATSPVGPFTPTADTPLICQLDLGGSIDASPFVNVDGTPWLLWKSDSNAIGAASRIYSQQLDPSGTVLLGEPVEILRSDRSWENPLIENPVMVHEAGSYWLFYSANWWESSRYAVGYARCEGPAGPCTKMTVNGPWYTSRDGAAGPGGQEFFRDHVGRLWMVYHAWEAGTTSYNAGGRRAMHINPVVFDDNGPQVVGTATGPLTY